jgi:hypothetical protein
MAITDNTRFFAKSSNLSSPLNNVKDSTNADLNHLAHQLKEIVAEVNKTLHSLSFKHDVNLTQFWALQLMCVKRVVNQLAEDINQKISKASDSYGIEPAKVAKAIRNGLFAAADKEPEVAAPMIELAARISETYGVDATPNNSISYAA